VADNVFEADGDNYKATIEMSKSEEMISPNNPVTDVEALAGELGEITYEGDETGCVVTIPVALDDMVINYVVNFVQKPDFTLTYLNTDGSTMGTQLVEKDAAIGEFGVDFNEAIAEEGYKVRGWFEKKYGGKKYTTNDIITEDKTLYAVATEIEEPSDYKKYIFDLTSTTFYPEDHEAFASTGSGYWHDVQHGWAFNNGDVITLLVGEKANIFVTNCQYSNGNAQLVFKDAEGNEVEVTTSNLFLLRNRALIKELIQWNQYGNYDRVMALVQLMLYREEKMILYQGESSKRDIKPTGMAADDYWSRNYHSKGNIVWQ
jgi:hypothetical protein